jgi:alkylhydroperoxidase/carboxymuconolactone decarboxylase family protein YurZ
MAPRRARSAAHAPPDPADLADPRYIRLRARHDPVVVDLALRLRPRHHLDMLEFLDAIDRDAAAAWLAYVYGGLYARGVLDERTRLLCVVGDCIAADERTQARAHMANALRSGATSREIAEVVIQSSRAFGQPLKVRYLAILVDLLNELGRLAELGDPPAPRPEWLR